MLAIAVGGYFALSEPVGTSFFIKGLAVLLIGLLVFVYDATVRLLGWGPSPKSDLGSINDGSA